MSLILDALNAKKTEKEADQKKEPLSPEEGLFFGKQGFLKKADKKLSPRLIVLSVIFGLLLTGTVVLHYYSQRAIAPTPIPAPPASPSALQAEVTAEKVIFKNLTGPDIAKRLASAGEKFEQQDYDASLKILQGLQNNAQDNVEVYNDLGLLYLKKKLFSSAEKYFTLALEQETNCAVCLNNFGYLKTLLNETAEAQAYLKQAAQLDDKYAQPHFNLGVLYEKNGDIAKAVSHYRQFLEKSPKANVEIVKAVELRLHELVGR